MAKDPGRERVNLRLPADLVRWAKRYAQTRNKSFTSVVEEALREAMEGDQRREMIARKILRKEGLNASNV